MYLNIHYEKEPDGYGGNIHIWDDQFGYKTIPYKKYAYKLDPDGEYKTLYGQKCKLVRRWSREDVESGIMCETDIYPVNRYLIDNYLHDDNPSDKHRKVVFDIETTTEHSTGDMSYDISVAVNKITSISYYYYITNKYRVYILDADKKITDFTMEKWDSHIDVLRFDTEQELLLNFIEDINQINPTILIGWNSDYFDIPYLYNRIEKLFGQGYGSVLSPINIVNYNMREKKYFIAGVTSYDLMLLYKNKTLNSKESVSYTLDYVASNEVKESKIEYEGSLDKLLEEDIEKYIEYNVNDVRLVKLIDDKRKLVELSLGICHKGHVPLEDIYYSSRYIDGAIAVYLKRKGNIVIPNKKGGYQPDVSDLENDEKFSGAYVKEPIPGLYKLLIDFDFTSLYPSIIRTLNISPETKVGVVKNWKEIEKNYSFNL